MISKKNKKQTLSDKISDLLKAPELHDPEDDIYEETKAKTADADSDFENNEELDTVLSSFRKQNAKLLQDIDKKYVGKPVSRKTLGLEAFENESGVSSAEDETDSENEKSVGAFVKINAKGADNSDDDSIISKDSLQNSHDDNKQSDISDDVNDKFSNLSDSEDNQLHDTSDIESDQQSDISDELSKSKAESDFSEDSELDDDEDAEGDVGITDYENIKDSAEKSNFKHLNSGNASEAVQKGNAVRQQLHIWEKLMEMRIHSQKILLSANKLPKYDEFNDFMGLPNSEFDDKARESKHLLTKLLNKFIDLQQLLLKKYPETKNLTKSGENKKTSEDAGDGMDEEIPSDTEEEIEDKSEDEAEIPTKRRKISDLPHILSEQHGLYSSYRNTVIQKWHDKVRVASGVMNNKNLSTGSLIKHIEYILADKERLRKRTQLKRSKYDILTLNKPEEVTEISQSGDDAENCGTKQNDEEFSSEIFDDDDFYHQLLRELIEYKTANVSDPVQLSKQWIELQQLRNKMKRKIDTKATKGRRIRYTVHSKLVNFMAPEENSTWTDDAKDELFGSIFGGKMKSKVLDASSSK